ncbi:ABC transporter ATP-binding protein [Pseudohongiella nitratireducens]|jgi:putative ABC transport system ATP-binding protein|uniref:ABC transporter ATP-binding protein n=1 Tax=Pseudohongiella nitratireducens TaxID=1768907 RepID=A0A916QLR9_9GAMM|nr:ATP-binding cassette domain-containing protein [Pseudohongiella nitratireducens]MDF1622773.1 ATP-binding cassette domain-containing protein [Pseudohongiella nitratireducens]GFZ76719.1 ABC transporter ATP-binding protein [Pseudohongiella nitratireducens]
MNSKADYQVSSQAIDVKHLQYAWSGNESLTLDIPEFSLSVGERCFLLGSSGSGKSTLLRLLSGLLIPSAGSINILNQNLAAMSVRARDRFRAHQIGFIFQQFNLIPYLSILDNLEVSAKLNKLSDKTFRARASELLTRLSVAENLWRRRADQLSVGQQQRVAIARAMIHHPPLLIADEPTSALDEDARDAFMQLLLNDLTESDTTILFVSHDRQLISHFNRCESMNELNQALAIPDTTEASA